MAEDGDAELLEGSPRDFEALRAALVARKGALPKRLAQVAAFTMANPDEIAFGTAASIAESANVQPSTLVRFAQALGYQGFSDLQSVFRERLRERVPSYDERLKALREHPPAIARTHALINGFADVAEQSIRALRARLKPELIEAATALLAPADVIYLIGQRRSFPVTSYLNYVFGKLGIKNVLIGSAAGNDPETLSFARASDAGIAVGFTPYASSTVDYARRLAERGAPLVVITDSPFSPLLPQHGVWFEVVEKDFEGFRPLSATMVLAMALAVMVAQARG